MNIVIPLFIYRDNIELRYALRSLKNLRNVENVYIVADKLPAWIQNVSLISCNDVIGEQYKEWSIFRKLLKAAETLPEFLYMNDDHYILQPLDANEFPVYHKGILDANSRLPNDTYRQTILNTLRYCSGTMNYDTHCPINMRADILQSIKVDWKRPYGYCVKTLYVNRAIAEAVSTGNQANIGSFHPDFKLYRSAEIPHKAPYFSTDNRAMDEKMVNRFENKFPSKSIYEK